MTDLFIPTPYQQVDSSSQGHTETTIPLRPVKICKLHTERSHPKTIIYDIYITFGNNFGNCVQVGPERASLAARPLSINEETPFFFLFHFLFFSYFFFLD